MGIAGTPATTTQAAAIAQELLALRQGRGLADVTRITRAARLLTLPIFGDDQSKHAAEFWQALDEIREVEDIPSPRIRPGRIAPSGRDWHRLLCVIFNRSQSPSAYTLRIKTASNNLPHDFPTLAEYYSVSSATSSEWNYVAADAIQVLARWLTAEITDEMIPHQTEPEIEKRSIATARVVISSSVVRYSQLIVAHEYGAQQIDRIPKRLSVLFKGEEAIAQIAEQRFGPGSVQIQAYIREHQERKRQFYEKIADGLVCREIYSKSELIGYFHSGSHGPRVRVDQRNLDTNVANWVQCLQDFPNYMVALTEEAVPFKYEIVNGTTVIIHEAVSGNDSDRLNAVVIESTAVGRQFLQDFDLIWDRTQFDARTPNSVIKWIIEQKELADAAR